MVAIVGDIHFKEYTRSRKDNIVDAALAKLEEICNDNDDIIFLGDVTDKPTLRFDSLIKIYTFLKQRIDGIGCRKNTFYTILGNHDLENEREDSLPATALGLLSALGLIKVIQPNESTYIDGRRFVTTYVNLERAKANIAELEVSPDMILLLHHFVDDEFAGFTSKELYDKGFRVVFQGHQHEPLPNGWKQENGLTVFRPGSLVRLTNDTFNLTRIPQYVKLSDEATNIVPIGCCKQAADAYYEDSLNRVQYKRKKDLKNIDKVLESYKQSASATLSISNALKQLNASPDVCNFIKSIYTQLGERYE